MLVWSQTHRTDSSLNSDVTSLVVFEQKTPTLNFDLMTTKFLSEGVTIWKSLEFNSHDEVTSSASSFDWFSTIFDAQIESQITIFTKNLKIIPVPKSMWNLQCLQTKLFRLQMSIQIHFDWLKRRHRVLCVRENMEWIFKLFQVEKSCSILVEICKITNNELVHTAESRWPNK